MEWITDNNPIRHINTAEVKLSEDEVVRLTESAYYIPFLPAFYL